MLFRLVLQGWLGCLLLGSGSALAVSHALIMTIGDYEGGVTPLAGVSRDAESARTIAKRMGVKDENILQLHDRQLTAEGMRKAFDTLISRIGNNDEVFVYYSGHGGRQYVKDPDERCAESLITVDGGGFIDAELEQKLKSIAEKARRLVVFLDACHSGGATKRAVTEGKPVRFVPKYWSKGKADACARPSNIITRSLSAKTRALGSGAQNYVFIAAAKDSEVSLDEPAKGGLATQAWLKCMSGEARDANGSGGISAEELRDCAQQRINTTVDGVPGIEPHHIQIAGNANAVMLMKEAEAKTDAVNPYDTLQDIYSGRDDRRLVTLAAKRPSLQIGKDKLEFSLTSSHAGHVYILMTGSDGKEFDLLFPNALDKGHYLEAGETLLLPAPNWQITAQGPKGKDHLLAIVSDAELDFSGLGAKAAGPFSVIDADSESVRDIQTVTSGKRQAGCGSGAAREEDCAGGYGAAMLSIEEVE